MTTAPHVAVIGAGFSGLLTTVQILRQMPDATVELIERVEEFGQGAAYSTQNPRHVLNVRLPNMSAFPDQPDHLAEWLSRQSSWSAQDAFITRGDYGRYLRDILKEAQEDASGARLRLRHADALGLERAGEGWRVRLGDGETIIADAVVLALGNLEPVRPAGLDPAVEAAGRFIADPWRSPTGLPEDARSVLLIGTGMTMVDVALSLRDSGRRLTAVSRRGLTPRAHRPVPSGELAALYAGSPSSVLRQARRRAQTLDWRQVADDLRQSARLVWRSWSSSERRQFLRHLRPIWEVHRHRLAPGVAADIQAMIASGQLTIEAGRIQDIDLDGDKVVVRWRRRGASRRTTKLVGAVVNCTGPLTDVSQSRTPVVADLIDNRIAGGDPDGLGLSVDDDCRIVGADGAAQPGLYAVGPLTRGAFWEMTSVPDIRIQAAEVAATLRADHAS